jgi:hypothetical protein
LRIHGAGIGIWPRKDGYYYNLKLWPGRPNDYKPDPKNPIVFTMWKIHGPEPLVTSEIDAKIMPDGKITAFKMATGKVIPQGDVNVTVSRFPFETVRGKSRFDWNAKVEIVGGGLLEQNDPYPYWAPEIGYKSSFELNVNSNELHWIPYINKTFFLKNSDGQFGLLRLHINADVTPVRFQASFTINPSGSQNLEPSTFP